MEEYCRWRLPSFVFSDSANVVYLHGAFCVVWKDSQLVRRSLRRVYFAAVLLFVWFTRGMLVGARSSVEKWKMTETYFDTFFISDSVKTNRNTILSTYVGADCKRRCVQSLMCLLRCFLEPQELYNGYNLCKFVTRTKSNITMRADEKRKMKTRKHLCEQEWTKYKYQQ